MQLLSHPVTPLVAFTQVHPPKPPQFMSNQQTSTTLNNNQPECHLNMALEKPRFEILEKIGHGQFSNVFKARWINAPPPELDFSSSIRTPNLHLPYTGVCNDVAKHQCETTNRFLGPPTPTTSTKPVSRATTERYVALKRIKFYDIQDSKLRMDCIKEIKLLQQLRHPNIINYNISFIERNELFIVLELADGGDLLKLIKYFKKRKQPFSEQIILKYFTQVCSAVEYIHSKRILHRDIKPANIFMTSNGRVKLGDFGLSRFFSQNTHDVFSIVGTLYYMSPERICKSGYGFSSDVWSLGCVLYELITLNSPFSIINAEQQLMAPRPTTTSPDHQDPLKIYNCDRFAPQTVTNQQSQPQQVPQQQQNPYSIQWLVDRIVRAEYPNLNAYTNISEQIRRLVVECLNPDSEVRPNMTYICTVVSEVYRMYENQPR